MGNGNKLFLAKLDKDIIDQYTKSQIAFTEKGIVDASGKTWTNKGATIKTTGGRFGGGCLNTSANGTDNGISCAANDDFNFGSEDFTVELWFKPNAVPVTCSLIGYGPGGMAPFWIALIGSDAPYTPKINGINMYISFDNSNWAASQNISYAFTAGVWYHVALVRKGTLFTFYLNGVSKYTFTSSASFTKSSEPISIGSNSLGLNPNCSISDVRISKGIARYSSSFVPSNFTTKGYYSRKDGKWSHLDIPTNDLELINMFKTYGTQDCPTQAQLEEIGTGVNRPRRCCWQENATDELPTVKLKAVPKDKLLLPKNLIKIDSLEEIDNVTIVKTLSGNSEIKFIITTDLSTYKTFNFTSGAWETIDHTNLATVKTNGIDSTLLSTIVRAQWDLLTTGTSGVGFAILLSQEASADDCKLDLLSLHINGGGSGEGSWDKAIHGTDYKYGYPKSNLLRVTLLTDGDYKINYREGAKEI